MSNLKSSRKKSIESLLFFLYQSIYYVVYEMLFFCMKTKKYWSDNKKSHRKTTYLLAFMLWRLIGSAGKNPDEYVSPDFDLAKAGNRKSSG